ncbi:glycosyltransferase family 2 protein [Candidatus Saccharibacteria bacterium CG10_big_fil_rev_8_21_14_0_10_47_8]|nr:MAG: glycosyltransferase family 2 protein [Candidatus Saccharibacteria bacterium CG10_big_fil_rev_8_21_14_0_10_47_8]
MKILVTIPTYNCERQIPRVLAGFNKRLLDRVEKVIIIDNGSTDKTVEAAQTATKKLATSKVEVWQNKNNYNLGGTHKVAFLTGEKLGMDYVAILHGDNQAKTEELDLLIDEAKKNPEHGAILGCRFMKDSKLNGYSWQRVWGNRGINWIYSMVALRPSRDLGSGLNLFRLKDLNDHNYLGFGDNITFNIDLLLDYFKKKTLLKFVPITWSETDQVSNARNFQVGKTALIKLFRWRFGKEQRLERSANYYQSDKV